MKTTAKDFALFKASCEEWLEKLSLGDWEVRYQHVPMHDALASVTADTEAKVALVQLSTEWVDDPVTPANLRFNARHEVLHILFADLSDLARSRVNTPAMWIAAEHAAVRRLEKVL